MTYNLCSRTRARASSVSTPASEKNRPVRDDFGQLIVNLLSCAHAQDKGASFMAPEPMGSPLTSVAGSPKTVTGSPSALKHVHSYSDVVRASSPVNDPWVVRESSTPTSPVAGVSAMSNNIDTGNEDECASPKQTERHESTSNDDHPWIKVFRKGRTRVKNPEPGSEEPRTTAERAEQTPTEEWQRLTGKTPNVSMTNTTAMENTDRGEGNSKGKGIDPQNWGALDDEEFDLKEQRAALESFKTAWDLAS
jgi:hypothetical protein